MNRRPAISTGGKGLPLAKTARPSDQRKASSAVHFGARGRVRQREDDRALVDPCHGLDHLAAEQFRNGAQADDAGRPQCLDCLDEGGDRCALLHEGLLKIGKIGARSHQQAIDVK
jgi:hypothetical protein